MMREHVPVALYLGHPNFSNAFFGFLANPAQAFMTYFCTFSSTTSFATFVKSSVAPKTNPISLPCHAPEPVKRKVLVYSPNQR
jgi:hypothetical protein